MQAVGLAAGKNTGSLSMVWEHCQGNEQAENSSGPVIAVIGGPGQDRMIT